MATSTLSSPLDKFFRTAGPGKETSARLWRTRIIYALMFIAGIVPMALNLRPEWQALGLGLWFPGAGFLVSGGWSLLLLPITLLLFAVALFAWLASGMLIAPLVIWSGSAALAAALADTPASWPAIIVALVFIAGWQFRLRSKRKVRVAGQMERRTQRIDYLPEALARIEEIAAPVPAPGTREMDLEQLAALRYCLDRALQPAGDWTHYNRIDQFQPAALRYQLNNLGYTIGVAQCHYTPNFHGYMSEAQRAVIEKMLRREVWSYWRLERLWGSFSTEFDPVADDNVMLSGFYGINLGLYQSNTGDTRYSEPDSLVFRWNDRQAFAHSFGSTIRSITQNMDRSKLSLYPCEPNWVYTPCNFRAMTSLMLHDRLCGTQHAQTRLDNFMTKLNDEFTLPDGSILTVASAHLGMALPLPFGETTRSFMMTPFNREHARIAWAIARHEGVKDNADGTVEIVLQGKGVDFGNYSKGHAATLAALMVAAAEMGDQPVWQAAKAKLEELYPAKMEDGVAFYPCSNSARALISQALIAGRDDWRNAIVAGPAETSKSGPLLEAVPYPEVLVAKAVSSGSDLELVLYPGRECDSVGIDISRLIPGQCYQITGSTVSEAVADAEGKARLQVQLRGRTEVRIHPVVSDQAQ
jgi:hypothetical protein